MNSTVNNKKIIRLLTLRSLLANRARNLVAILAIALTATLFTTVFSIGSNMLNSMQVSLMRQVGTQAPVGLKYLTQQQYDHISASPLIRDISYNIVLGIAENPTLRKSQTEIRYTQDKSAEWSFCMPTVGDLPQQGMELACSTITLDLLGIPHELGQSVPLEFTLYGQQIAAQFTLCGYWTGDPVAMAQQVYVSREYLDDTVVLPDVFDPALGMDSMIGTISADIWFSGTNRLERRADELLAERGYQPDDITVGISWGYLGGPNPDPTVMLSLFGIVLLILGSGYLIIYCVFSISVAGDIKFYGLLKTIGTTGRQLRRMVRLQALALSALGVPLGFALGFGLGAALTPVVLQSTALHDMAAVSADWRIFAFSGLFSLLTVGISCRRPGRMAAKVSPVEAVRYAEARTDRRRDRKPGRVTPRAMALANLTRNRGKLMTVVASLSLSVMLLNVTASLAGGLDLELFLANQMRHDFLVTDYSIQNYAVANKNYQGVSQAARDDIAALPGLTGMSEIWFYDDLTHQLSAQGQANVSALLDLHSAALLASYRGLAMAEDSIAAARAGTMALHVYGVGDLVLPDDLVTDADPAELADGDYVLVSQFVISDTLKDTSPRAIYQKGDTLTLVNAEGQSRDFTVLGNIASYPYNVSAQHSHVVDGDVIMTDRAFRDFYHNEAPMTVVYNVEDAQLPAAEAWLEQVSETTYDNLAYVSRESLKVEFESFRNTYVMLGGVLSAILALIGFLNFINAIFTQITARRRELAMLQSVGMTGRQMTAMLFWEGASYALLTLATALTVGLPLSGLMIQTITSDLSFFLWNFNVWPALLTLPVLLFACAAVPLICTACLNRASLVERLRTGD